MVPVSEACVMWITTKSLKHIMLSCSVFSYIDFLHGSIPNLRARDQNCKFDWSAEILALLFSLLLLNEDYYCGIESKDRYDTKRVVQQ